MSQDILTEIDLRALTENLLRDWYENEVYLGREEYFDERRAKRKLSVEVPEDRIREIDPLAQAKKDRPWAWNTHFSRRYTAYDHEGNEIELEETLSILDTFGSGPNETRRPLTSRTPDGSAYIRVDYTADKDTKTQIKIQYLKRIHQSIRHLDHFAPSYLVILRWYLGGKTEGSIASQLKINKSTVAKYKESAITWVMGCVAENPIWREYEPEFRALLKEHHAEMRQKNALDA